MHTLISSKRFEYRKVQNFAETKSQPAKELYSFKSNKSNQVYWVWVEKYPYSFYAIKFHLKNHKHCSRKYNRLTRLYEAKPVIMTCIDIMIEIHKREQKSSFGFLGANTIELSTSRRKSKKEEVLFIEPKENTKRYRAYKRFMITFFSDELFEHKYNEEKSTYLLVRKSEIVKNPNLIENIVDHFSTNYTLFA